MAICHYSHPHPHFNPPHPCQTPVDQAMPFVVCREKRIEMEFVAWTSRGENGTLMQKNWDKTKHAKPERQSHATGLGFRTGMLGLPPGLAQLTRLSVLLPSLGKKKAAALFDSQAPICPICQVLLRPSELQEHMEQELEQLAQLPSSKNSLLKDAMAPGTPKSLLLSASIKREGESPTASPHSSATDDLHHSDRYQTFLRVRANRQTRLNARIGKMKRRKQDEGQREGSCMAEDDAVDIEHENNNRFEEYEWCGQKRIRATTLLEGGFRGSGFIMCSGKENPDSDADLDVDGDDTLEYGKPQYTEADVIPCTGEEPGEAKEREALRGAVLNGGPPSTRITPEFSKWASDEMPSTSNGESSKQEAMQKTCKNSDIEKITEDSAVTTFEALKARVRELERQLSRGDRYKCLICMDSYSMPLTSIQCWHVHCEECWLRTLGAKKLCPQCNTITAPGDLRRIYL
uniref:E3 ubiquitin-protein ligase RNF220 n=1 Tax=Pan troglodytes TaxID=9598 RepID=H2R1K7_PANTR